jgi:hypothetical protein
MSNPLAILHTEASLGWGGQQIRILSEAQGFIRRGHHVAVACPAEARIFAEAPSYGVPAIALPIGRKRPVGVGALIEFLKRHPVHAVSSHDSTDSWLAALALLVLRRPMPLVRTCHTSAAVSRDPLASWLYGRAISRIVTTDEASKRRLAERNRIPEWKVDAVPDASEPMLDRMEMIYRQVSGRR